MIPLILLASLQVPARPSTVTEVSGLSVTVLPAPPYLIATPEARYLNFDFQLRSERSDTLDIDTIQLSVFGRDGQMQLRKSVNQNGVRPGIRTLHRTDIPGGTTISVFNPFHTFPSYVELHRLLYEFFFDVRGTTQHYRMAVNVSPAAYVMKTRLSLPLK